VNASRKHSWSRLLPESLSDSENCVLHRLSRNGGKSYNSLHNPLLAAHNLQERTCHVLCDRCLKTRYPILFQYYITPKEFLRITQWHSPPSACNFHPTHLYQCYTLCTLSICLSHGKFVLKSHWNLLDSHIHSVYNPDPKPFVIFISSMHSRPHHLPRDAALSALK